MSPLLGLRATRSREKEPSLGSSFVFDFESALRLALRKSADFLEKRRSPLPVPPAYPLPIRVLDFGILSRPALVSDEDEEP